MLSAGDIKNCPPSELEIKYVEKLDTSYVPTTTVKEIMEVNVTSATITIKDYVTAPTKGWTGYRIMMRVTSDYVVGNDNFWAARFNIT
mgnify:CR=1 FL=1